MHSTRQLFSLGVAALLGATLGACFDGNQAEGLPCTANSHCGPMLECIDGFCGGVVVCGDGSTVAAELACNGTSDCEDAADEDPSLCGTDAFFCADDTTIPFTLVCDQSNDCPDGEDEAVAVCVHDQCSSPTEVFQYFDGPSGTGADNPLGLFGGQFIGDGKTDFVLAEREGSFARLVETPIGEMPIITELAGDNDDDDPLPNFLTPIHDIYTYDFENDGDSDLLILTSDSRLFAYISDPPAAPSQIQSNDDMGGTQPSFQIPGVQIVDMGLGKLNTDTFVDIVALTDEGVVFTAIGDVQKAALGENPFEVELVPLVVDGSVFSQVLLADLFGDSTDELLIIGVATMPQLWIYERKFGMVMDSWELNAAQALPFGASEVVVGNFDDAMGRDIAFLEGMGGRVAILHQGPQGSFMAAGEPVELGYPISGLTPVDLDCFGGDELMFNIEAPPGVGVLFPNDMAELRADKMLTIASAGKPQGNLALVQFDPDGSWDIFHAIGRESSMAGPEFHGLVTSDPGAGPP